MKDKERDILDDLFRSKLYDFEVETMPDDWEAISGRLPGKAPVPFRKKMYYWASAAVISLLMITGGVYTLNEEEQAPVAETIRLKTEAVESRLEEKEETPVISVEPKQPVAVVPLAAIQRGVVKEIKQTDKNTVAFSVVEADDSEEMENTENAAVLSLSDSSETNVVAESEVDVQEEAGASEPRLRALQSRTLLADAEPVRKKTGKIPARKWGFGMGGGSITAGSDNSINTYAFRNTMMTDQELLFMNAVNFEQNKAPKTDIKHKTPVSVGFSVSRFLNDRFSLQTGLNYTYLSSEWKTSGNPHKETKQKLHFIGIPLSLSYKIAEWERIQFYAAAGAMTEVNVAGKLNVKKIKDDIVFDKESERIRMKEWMWSVNARLGASYPLLRFLSLYAEVGAGYYFDNGSEIETIRSDKPFNVNLQAGFRLGF